MLRGVQRILWRLRNAQWHTDIGARLLQWLYRYPLLWASLVVITGGQVAWWAGRVDAALWWALLAIVIGSTTVALSIQRHGVMRLLAAAIALFCFGAWHVSGRIPAAADSLSVRADRAATPILLRGVIARGAVWRPNANYRPGQPLDAQWLTEWVIRCNALQTGDQWLPVRADALLIATGRIVDILPGDRVEITGQIRRIIPPTNPGQFDYANYMQHRGVFTRIHVDSPDQIQRFGWQRKWWFARARARLVAWVDGNLRRYVGTTHAPLAAALVIGQRRQVDWEQQQYLMATGTLHLLAISGLHVEIVAWFVLLLCTLLRTDGAWRVALISLVCGFYALLADAKPPVIRAVVLMVAFEYCRWLGRRTRLANLLGLAALVLFLLQVSYLHETGVHLSFLAVAAIGLFAPSPPPSDRRTWPLPVIDNPAPTRSALRGIARLLGQWLVTAWRISFWVWLATLPLIWTHFHVVAPIAVPLNLVIAVPLTFSLIGGLLAGMMDWLPPLAWLAGSVCHVGLSTIVAIVRAASQVPGGHIWLPAPPWWWVALFYATVIAFLLGFGKRKRGLLATLLIAWVVCGVGWFAPGPKGYWGGALASSNRTPDDLTVTFLDVGHGLAVIIEKPDGAVWLYDAGRLGAPSSSHHTIATALWAQGVARIEQIIVSHADADHYNAIPGLLDRFAVGRVVSTPQFWRHRDDAVRELKRLLETLGIEAHQWQKGMRIAQPDGLRIVVYHPPNDFPTATDNAASLCMALEFAGHRIMLTGDVEEYGLFQLTSEPTQPADVLLVPHHGSLAVDALSLMQWCQPQWLVISGGQRAARPAVLRTYGAASRNLAITFRDGAVQIRVDRDGRMTVYHWQDNQWRPLHSAKVNSP